MSVYEIKFRKDCSDADLKEITEYLILGLNVQYYEVQKDPDSHRGEG